MSAIKKRRKETRCIDSTTTHRWIDPQAWYLLAARYLAKINGSAVAEGLAGQAYLAKAKLPFILAK